MITIHENTATAFQSNGLGVIPAVRCEVTEQINGENSLVMGVYDADMVREHRILCVTTPSGKQPFRIYKVEKSLSGYVTIYARHLSYDLLGSIIEDRAPTDAMVAEALQVALEGTPFNGSSNVAGIQSTRWIRKTPIAAILGDEEESIVSRWGGEIERDGYAINIWQRLGEDHGVSIRYRKNLTGLIATSDVSGIVTRIMPTGLREDGQTILSLPEKYVDSLRINNYPLPYTQHIHYGNIKVGEEYPTESDVFTALREAATAEFEAGVDLPKVTLDVEFIDLSQTIEYAHYAVLERVYLGDTVHCYHEDLGVDVSLRVMSTRWDAIGERYLEITLGQPQRTILQEINRQYSQIPTLITQQTALRSAIEIATGLLNNPGKSYVKFLPSLSNPAEIYIMDHEDSGQARNVTRINSAGWAISQNGTDGPYTMVATPNSGLVAEAITGGTIRADVFFTGVLLAASGTITDLIAGIPTAQHLRMGSDEFNEPYLTLFDNSNTPQTTLYKRGIKFGTESDMARYSIGNRRGVGIFVGGDQNG